MSKALAEYAAQRRKWGDRVLVCDILDKFMGTENDAKQVRQWLEEHELLHLPRRYNGFFNLTRGSVDDFKLLLLCEHIALNWNGLSEWEVLDGDERRKYLNKIRDTAKKLAELLEHNSDRPIFYPALCYLDEDIALGILNQLTFKVDAESCSELGLFENDRGLYEIKPESKLADREEKGVSLISMRLAAFIERSLPIQGRLEWVDEEARITESTTRKDGKVTSKTPLDIPIRMLAPKPSLLGENTQWLPSLILRIAKQAKDPDFGRRVNPRDNNKIREADEKAGSGDREAIGVEAKLYARFLLEYLRITYKLKGKQRPLAMMEAVFGVYAPHLPITTKTLEDWLSEEE